MRRRATEVSVVIPGDKSPSLERVLSVYNGSDGEKTRWLYAELTQVCGPAGEIATNLLRAQKTSSRAKAYRGGDSRGRYSTQSYDTKQWSIGNLCRLLAQHGASLGITWGWSEDAAAEFHKWVLYLDLPVHGQVSFHTSVRGDGPDYPRAWDGVRGVSAERVIRFAADVLDRSHQEKAA